IRAVGNPDSISSGPASLLMLVMREALANVRKHAGASSVHLRLVEKADHVRLRIADNGNGFDVAVALRGAERGQTFGLALMDQRMRLLGGGLQITSKPGKGT